MQQRIEICTFFTTYSQTAFLFLLNRWGCEDFPTTLCRGGIRTHVSTDAPDWNLEGHSTN